MTLNQKDPVIYFGFILINSLPNSPSSTLLHMIEFHLLYWKVLVFVLMQSKSHYKSVKFYFYFGLVYEKTNTPYMA